MANKSESHAAVLMICAHCHRVRDAEGRWLAARSDAERTAAYVSHGICPDCLKALFPDDEERAVPLWPTDAATEAGSKGAPAPDSPSPA